VPPHRFSEKVIRVRRLNLDLAQLEDAAPGESRGDRRGRLERALRSIVHSRANSATRGA
jgi:hypothetical protein